MSKTILKLKEIKEQTYSSNQTKIPKGKNPRRDYYALMLFLSCLPSTEIGVADLARALGNMKHLDYIATAFWRIHILIARWNYKVQLASEIVSQMVPKGEVRSLLERLSQALTAGMKMRDFSRVESTKFMVQFEAEYARITDRLKQTSEAFSAILTSVSFLAVSILISNMMFSIGNPIVTMFATGCAIGGTLFSMLFLMRIYTPKEQLLAQSVRIPPQISRLHFLNRPVQIVGLIIGFAIPIMLLIMSPSKSDIQYVLGIPLMIGGAPLFLLGRTGKRRVQKVKLMEEQFPTFIKNFGDAFSVTSSSREAIRVLSSSDYGKLNGPIANLGKRLQSGISNELAWRFFIEECGSDEIDLHTHAMQDALALGARAVAASDAVFTSFVAGQSRRKKRDLVSGFLKAVIIPLQMTFTGVLVLVQALVSFFRLFANEAAQFVVLLSPINQNLINFYVYGIVVATIIGTAYAIQLVEGESEFDFTYYLGMIMLATGSIVLAVGFGANALMNKLIASGQSV